MDENVGIHEYLHERESHYTRFLGPLDQQIYHSTDIKPVHIDIYQFAPTEDRPYWTLITGGMSDGPQLVPLAEDYRSPRAEILMYAAEPKPWMISVLKGLAEMPFEHDTHLHYWHTVQNGQPMTAEPSKLTAYFFLPPYFEHPEFPRLTIAGDRVDFLWMIPITEAERQYAVRKGGQALERVIERANPPIVVDESRRSLVHARRFGRFWKR